MFDVQIQIQIHYNLVLGKNLIKFQNQLTYTSTRTDRLRIIYMCLSRSICDISRKPNQTKPNGKVGIKRSHVFINHEAQIIWTKIQYEIYYFLVSPSPSPQSPRAESISSASSTAFRDLWVFLCTENGHVKSLVTLRDEKPKCLFTVKRQRLLYFNCKR